MHAVGNHGSVSRRWKQSTGDDPWVAMTHRTHRIEHVGEHSCAGGDPGCRLFRGSIAMTERDRYSLGSEPGDRVNRSVEFRCECDEPKILEPEHAFQISASGWRLS